LAALAFECHTWELKLKEPTMEEFMMIVHDILKAEACYWYYDKIDHE
jgi:hypothetical protein